jgi:hypothetical protein
MTIRVPDSAMEAIIDGFFSTHDFGPAGDDAGLAYQHYDAADAVAVFHARESRIAEVEPLVAAAVEVLARSYPECAALQYRIDSL